MVSLSWQILFLAALIVVLFLWELLFPYKEQGDYKKKLGHAVSSGIIYLVNLGVVLAATTLVQQRINLSYQGILGSGLFAPWLVFLISLLCLDLLSYTMHVMYHTVPWMWKIHRTHHLDQYMDVTTAARFHPLEQLLSLLVRSLLILGLGIPVLYLGVYEFLFLANVLIHHANIMFPLWLEKIYRKVLTSPGMHKVHHSQVISESNSNYTSLLSIWDRIFRTYRRRENPKEINFGVQGIDASTSVELLADPFRN